MLKYEYGNKNTENVLLQMVDDHDISEIPAEMARIKETAKALAEAQRKRWMK